MSNTVAVTGGNGKIGERILEDLSRNDYHTVNIARGSQREDVSDRYVTTDLEVPGEVYGAIARSDPDAIIHMGTIPTPLSHPGYVTYRNNVMSTYHVLEAAEAVGVENVCLASSINAMGASFQETPIEVEYLPVDENHPVTPRDPYAIAKHVIEVTAAGFGRRTGAPTTVSTFRYPWVARGEELEAFDADDRTIEHATEMPGGRNELFSYVHLDDAAAAARRAIEADFSGHETFWIVAEDTTMVTPSAELAERFFPEADRRSELDEARSLIETSKATRLLDWEPERSWRTRE